MKNLILLASLALTMSACMDPNQPMGFMPEGQDQILQGGFAHPVTIAFPKTDNPTLIYLQDGKMVKEASALNEMRPSCELTIRNIAFAHPELVRESRIKSVTLPLAPGSASIYITRNGNEFQLKSYFKVKLPNSEEKETVRIKGGLICLRGTGSVVDDILNMYPWELLPIFGLVPQY